MVSKILLAFFAIVALSAATPIFFKGLGGHGGGYHEHHIINVPLHVPERIHNVHHHHVEKIHVPVVKKVFVHEHHDHHDHHAHHDFHGDFHHGHVEHLDAPLHGGYW